MIICAGNTEQFSFAEPMGIGLSDMAMNLTRRCLFDKPEHILFIGSAGSYGKHRLFELVESASASNIEVSFLYKQSYTPVDNVVSCATEPEKDTLVNSSNYITTDKEASNKFLQLGPAIENMEFFSVLKVAQQFKIPASGIFCITNFCDNDAHTMYKNNYKKCLSLLEGHLNQKYNL